MWAMGDLSQLRMGVTASRRTEMISQVGVWRSLRWRLESLLGRVGGGLCRWGSEVTKIGGPLPVGVWTESHPDGVEL